LIPFRLDYTIEKILNNRLSTAQLCLQQMTGKLVKKTEAEEVLAKAEAHKLYLSENLGRDVGIRVAVLDFFENYYCLNN
jgi:hypothetical protein